MQLRIALAGNPNSGKTTLFNALTGSTQYVGNWPGVTVEKKEGKPFPCTNSPVQLSTPWPILRRQPFIRCGGAAALVRNQDF